MNVADFNYTLPTELIARYPLATRTASRLLCLNKNTGAITHNIFTDILALLNPNDLLVCNNSRVIPARLFGCKTSGGKVEILVERVLDHTRISAHVRASKSPKPESVIVISTELQFKVLRRQAELFELEFVRQTPEQQSLTVMDMIERMGQIPLPPYFHREPEESDKERYQTVFAEHKGSVAAPTAGLHFDAQLMQKIKDKGVEIDYVTLHVGAGTFAPVRVEDITQHRMHSEQIYVSAELCKKIHQTKAKGGRVIAVGTTSARCLETASQSGEIQAYMGDTDIFIYPGYQFQCVDGLLTNFHLPGSTLLMLVSALAGYKNIMQAYQLAIAEKYRFFSYGDAMFITA